MIGRDEMERDMKSERFLQMNGCQRQAVTREIVCV